MQLTTTQIKHFQSEIYSYYKRFSRSFAWRSTTNPYHIFISEIMLQQTQTKRVIPKYDLFIKKFPTWHHLACAPLNEVLAAWQGLGYNRRALFLYKSAKIIVEKYNAILPRSEKELIALPGIGAATAASIAAFAFNAPTVFVETNIRAVFINAFLSNKKAIDDKKILHLVAQTIDTQNPRTWYYALTDYGVMLKAQGINPINQSKHYQKQSPFHGSDRQIRGAIIRLLINQNVSRKNICTAMHNQYNASPQRTKAILEKLATEKFIAQEKNLYKINS